MFCHVVRNFPFHGGITCIYLEFAEYSGMFFVFCFTYQNGGGPVRTMRLDHCGSIHIVIAKDPGHYKVGTHDVRKSGLLRVYNRFKRGTHDVKKT